MKERERGSMVAFVFKVGLHGVQYTESFRVVFKNAKYMRLTSAQNSLSGINIECASM